MYIWQLLNDIFWNMGMLGQVGAASGGSTTTVVDSTLALSTDVKAGGTIMIVKTTDGLAPQGEAQRVNSNTSNTYTTNAYTAAVESGDEYVYISKDFNIYEFIRLVNRGLRKVGMIPLIDKTITTADSQREYTLPVALKRNQIANVQLQRSTDSNNNQWVPAFDWDIEQNNTAGGTGLLIFKKQPESGYNVKIEYYGEHPEITALSDTLHESVPPELAEAAFAYMLNSSRNSEAIASQSGYRDLYGSSRDEFNEALRRWPIAKHRVIRPALTFKRN
jgi:hypothetical protein